MKQETLEEFIESYVNKIDRSEDGLVEQCLKDAIKWQQERSSSEEDFKLFARQFYREIKLDNSNLLWEELADKCLEQFKKK